MVHLTCAGQGLLGQGHREGVSMSSGNPFYFS